MFLLLATVLVAIAGQLVHAGCPPHPTLDDEPWYQFGDSCYTYQFGKTDWAGAREACRAFEFNGNRGYLYAQGENDEREFVKKLIWAKAWRVDPEGSIVRPTWLGLNDIETEGDYQWADSEQTYAAADWRKWDVGQPDDSSVDADEDCGAIDYSTGGWGDESCGSKFRFVCEIQAS